jgi:hypothetical protein
VEVEGQTNVSLLEANETRGYHCAPVDIDEDDTVIDLLCSLDDDDYEEEEDHNDVPMDGSMDGIQIINA